MADQGLLPAIDLENSIVGNLPNFLSQNRRSIFLFLYIKWILVLCRMPMRSHLSSCFTRTP